MSRRWPLEPRFEPAVDEAWGPAAADAGECGLDLLDDEELLLVTSAIEFWDDVDDDDDDVDEVDDDDEDEFDDDELPVVSCEDDVPLISLDLTISCLASLVFVPGLVRFIFILRPLSTVAECSTAILPGFPALVCTALIALGCCFPVGQLPVELLFVFTAAVLALVLAELTKLAVLTDDELTPQDGNAEFDDEHDNDSEADWPLPLEIIVDDEFCVALEFCCT